MCEAYKDKRFLYINSANRLSGTSSSFSVQIQLPTNEEYDTCIVTQLSIPVSYYLIPIGSNTMQLSENGTIVTVTIPPGNYNINSFCTIVPPLLNASSPNDLTYTMSYPSAFTQNNTGYITYTVSNSGIACKFIFNAKNYLNEQFGFNSGSTVSFNNGTLTSTNVVNFINETTLFIHSDIVSNGSDDILQEVYGNNTQQLSVVTWTPPEIKGYSKLLKVPKNQILNIYLTDENNIPINLNGQNMQITLLCYRRGSFKQSILQFIEIVKTFIQWVIETFSQRE
jgi:hypothetical protein